MSLGLSVSYGIINKLEGGCVFTITLPDDVFVI
jgi:hypothetical protein